MRYLVRARVRPNRHEALLEAIERKRLGRGSVAEGEYLRNMRAARVRADGTEAWSCDSCDCSGRLEKNLAKNGEPFLAALRRRAANSSCVAALPTRHSLQVT